MWEVVYHSVVCAVGAVYHRRWGLLKCFALKTYRGIGGGCVGGVVTRAVAGSYTTLGGDALSTACENGV